jgi:hypothetical protein
VFQVCLPAITRAPILIRRSAERRELAAVRRFTQGDT